MSTVPEEETVVDPWNASSAVAPASVYVLPSSTVTVVSPEIVITGGILSLYPSSARLFKTAMEPKPIKAFE